MTYGRPIKIGTYTITERTESTRHYECAAWHTTIDVQPGTYDVFAHMDYYPEGVYLRHMSVDVSGPVKSACFTPLFGGNAIGPDTTGPKEVGEIRSIPMGLPTYGYTDMMPEALALDTRLVDVKTWATDRNRWDDVASKYVSEPAEMYSLQWNITRGV